MYKEILIILIVIVFVIGTDIISNNYTRSSFNSLIEKLDTLKVLILNKEREKALTEMKEIKQEWNEHYKLFALYIEHDELEKVVFNLVELNEYIKEKKYEEAKVEIETTKFILEHIQEKEKLSFKSIF